MLIGQHSYDNNQWMILRLQTPYRSPVLTKAADDFSLFKLITEVKIAHDYTKSKPLKSCSVLFWKLTLLTNSASINYNYESTFNDLKKKKQRTTSVNKTFIMYLFVVIMVPTRKKITTL